MTITSAVASEYASNINFGKVNRLHKYKGIDKYLQHACNEGGLLKDHFLYWVFREQGFDLQDERDNKSKTDVLSLFDILALYGKEIEQRYHKEHLQQAIQLAWSHFGYKEDFGKLCPLELDVSVMRDSIKLDKSSGFPSFAKKSDDLVRALNSSKKWLDETIRGCKRMLPPCVAYSRVQHGDMGPKTRLVWGFPLEVTLLEAKFARPLIDRYLGFKTPMAFGYWKYEIGARLQPITNGGIVYSLDYSKFDTSVPASLISVAFDILKSHFLIEKESDNYLWEEVVRYFIHTPIIMPDGHLYRKHRGVPSGSFFTQLVDSIVNYILIQYACIHVADHRVSRDRILVLGDDSIFSLPVNIPIDKFAKCLMKAFGVRVNVDKSEKTADACVHFLGHFWDRLLPMRESDDVVKRIVYPERFNPKLTTKELRQQRLAGYLSDGANVAPLLRELILGHKQHVYGVWRKLRIGSEPVTGYQEWMASLGMFEGDESSASAGALSQAYIGPIK